MIITKSTLSYKNQIVPPLVPAVQGDTGRHIIFTIKDYEIPEGATATFYIQKPSKEAVYNTATLDASNNTVEVELTAQCLAEYGENFGQIRIMLDGEVITSFDFILLVKAFRGIDAIESTSESNIFDQAVEAAAEQFQTEAEAIVDEVIESIPEDYSALSQDVTDLKADLSQKIISSANLLSTANNVPDTYINQRTGVETAYNGWQSSDYIIIDPTEGYYHIIWNNSYWNTPNSVYYAFYDSNKVYTHGNFTDATQGYIMQAMPGDAYLRVSAQNANMSTSRPMVGTVTDLGGIINSTDSDDYIAYGNTLAGDTLKIELDNYKAENNAAIASINENLKSIAILLPTTLYIAAGRQITLYKPNYLRCKNPDDYVCYWSTGLANTRFDENIRFRPSATGTYLAQLFIMNRYNGETVAQKNMNIVVVADTTRTGKKVLFLGDSLTAAGFYPYEIQKHLSGEGVESIGTLTTTAYLDSDPNVTTRVSVNHEGRGGWSAQDYITRADKSGVTNAFWNPNTSAFDFSYYLTNTGFSLPDIVFVNLGTNGTVNPTAEVNAIKTIITSIRARSATVPIVVSAIACGNATQDQYIDIYLTKIRELQLAEFDGVMSNVYIAPIYLNINRKMDWKTETVAESSRNPNEVTRQTDSVHPSKYGYYKFADIYWSVIQHILA